MAQNDDSDRLKAFDERLKAAQKSQEPDGPTHRGHTDTGAAWRMVIELVTGMGVGFGIGYGLDYVFGTLPIFLVIFCLLGFAAGIRVMVQTASELQKTNEAKQEAQDG